MTWLNLTMPNQTVKNGLKAKKIKLPQMNFFLKKQLIKFSCTYWLLSFCKILEKLLRPIQSYEDVPFSGPKCPIFYEQIFLGTNHYYYFNLPIGLFHCAKFLKILIEDPELWGCAIFGPKMIHLPQANFFLKINSITLIYLLAPFIVQNLKKILPTDPELWGCAIFGPKMAHFPKWEFFSENLLMSLVSFIHAYLHAKNQSQILIY